MISRPLRWAAQGAAVAVVAVGALTMAQYDKAVSLSLDGDTSSVHVFGSTVGDLLAKQDVPVGEHDIVQPAADAPLNDGDTVVIRYGRKLTVTMDGKTSDYWTTATSVDAALAELGIRADTAKLSVSRSEPLGRSGLALTITTPKNVTVNVDGGSKTVASTGPTVADALQQLEVTLGAQDRVNPAPETPLTEGLAVTINRVEKKSVSETQAVAFGVTNQDDATLAKGTKKTTTKGVAGEQSVTFDEVWVDGKLESRNQTGARSPRTRSTRSSPSAPRSPLPLPLPLRRPRRLRRPPATPPAPASTSRTPRCGTRSPSASPAATGTSTPATATTAGCSSRRARGSRTAVPTSPRAPTWPPGSSRSRSPTGSTPSPASNPGAASPDRAPAARREAPGMNGSPELLGAARVHDLAARLGLRPTKQWARTSSSTPTPSGGSSGWPASASAPSDERFMPWNPPRLADLMRRLHRHEVVDRDVSRTVLRWIGTNTDLSMVASAFDLDPLAHAEPDRGVRLVNKTGTISTVRADVGVVEGPAANAAYAVLASRAGDVDLRDAVLADMRRIGQIIRDHVGG